MSDFKLPPGSALNINLRRKPRRKRKGAPEATPGAKKGILPVDEETPRYIRRRNLTITFLDLGTRLRSVADSSFDELRYRPRADTAAPVRNDERTNEYVEIDYTSPGQISVNFDGGVPYGRLSLTTSQLNDLQSLLLGLPGDSLDPFGSTEANVTGRKLTHCMPLPYGNLLNLNAFINERHYLCGLASVIPAEEIPQEDLDRWELRKGKADEDEERWNPHNLAQWNLAGLPLTREGQLKPKGAVGHGLRIVTAYLHTYEPFDTDDAVNFKVTSEPSFDADAVLFKFSGSPHRVYLRPRLVMHTPDMALPYTSASNPDQTFYLPSGAAMWADDLFAWAGRFPVYPQFPLHSPLLSSFDRPVFEAYYSRSPHATAAHDRIKALVLSLPSETRELFGIPADGVYAGTPDRQGAAQVREETDPASTPFGARLSYSMTGLLVGVIARGASRFYVWRKTQDETRSTLSESAPVSVAEWDLESGV
jgi:hypothetical protein